MVGGGGEVTFIPPPAINDRSLIFPFDTRHICVLRTFKDLFFLEELSRAAPRMGSLVSFVLAPSGINVFSFFLSFLKDF